MTHAQAFKCTEQSFKSHSKEQASLLFQAHAPYSLMQEKGGQYIAGGSLQPTPALVRKIHMPPVVSHTQQVAIADSTKLVVTLT